MIHIKAIEGGIVFLQLLLIQDNTPYFLSLFLAFSIALHST